jgi:hypothetical protein
VLTEVFVALDSRGGKRREGVAMARLIRKTGMGTVVLPGARCASACMLVFFGGYDLRSKKPRRIAFQGARLGVHRSTLDLSPEEAKAELKADLIKILSAMQRSVGDMLLELNELDVSLEVQRRILTTDNTSMHYLTDAEKKGSQITVVSGRPGRWSVDSTDLPVTALPSGLWSILAAAQRDGATPSSRAGAPVTQPMASLRRAAGDVRELDLSVTASLGCIVASAREANLRAELCPDRDGLAFSLYFRDGTFGSYADWRPEFTGSNSVEFRDASGRAGLLKLRVTNASTTWVRVVTSPWQKQISGLGPPREILLDLDAVGLTLRLPPDSVDALWTAVLERHPSESL